MRERKRWHLANSLTYTLSLSHHLHTERRRETHTNQQLRTHIAIFMHGNGKIRKKMWKNGNVGMEWLLFLFSYTIHVTCSLLSASASLPVSLFDTLLGLRTYSLFKVFSYYKCSFFFNFFIFYFCTDLKTWSSSTCRLVLIFRKKKRKKKLVEITNPKIKRKNLKVVEVVAYSILAFHFHPPPSS